MKKKYYPLFLIFWLCQSSVMASMQLLSTRVIIEQGESVGTITIKGDDKGVYALQSWLTDTRGEPVSNVSTQPSFAILKAQHRQNINVVYQGKGLPTDRETLLLLTILPSPAIKTSELPQAAILPTVSQTVKVFYRPGSLNSDDADLALEQLNWAPAQIQQKTINFSFTNPTPYHAIFRSVMLVRKRGDEILGFYSNNNKGDTVQVSPLSEGAFLFDSPNAIQFHDGETLELWLIYVNQFGTRVLFSGELRSDGTLGPFKLMQRNEQEPIGPSSESIDEESVPVSDPMDLKPSSPSVDSKSRPPVNTSPVLQGTGVVG